MIQINLFTCAGKENRLPMTKAAIHEFSMIKDENKKDIELFIYHNHEQEELWEGIAQSVL